jgi:hypothetical protein
LKPVPYRGKYRRNKMDVDKNRMVILINVLLDEISVLHDMVEDLQTDLDQKDQLLAEKAEVIKMLGAKRKDRMMNMTAVPKKRGPGRPKGSKNSKSK